MVDGEGEEANIVNIYLLLALVPSGNAEVWPSGRSECTLAPRGCTSQRGGTGGVGARPHPCLKKDRVDETRGGYQSGVSKNVKGK